MQKKSIFKRFAALILIIAVCTGPAAAYLNYNIIWASSGNQFVKENELSSIAAGTTPTHFETYYGFTLAPSSSINVITPFTSTINVNGTEPVLRSLFFQLNMPAGVNVTRVTVNTGPLTYCDKNVNWAGTGTETLYTVDCGSYRPYNRGINTLMRVRNDQGTNQFVQTFGAGAKLQW
jgi:hypothetical protein